MVNMYKKLLVHQLDEDTLEDVNGKSAINEHVEVNGISIAVAPEGVAGTETER